jgi:hypothetical protein
MISMHSETSVHSLAIWDGLGRDPTSDQLNGSAYLKTLCLMTNTGRQPARFPVTLSMRRTLNCHPTYKWSCTEFLMSEALSN